VAAPIRVTPRVNARKLARLHGNTEDGLPEVYLLLREYRDTHGQLWILVRIPSRPNGQVGWVQRGALGDFHLTHWQVVVNEQLLRLFVYYRGRQRFSAPVAVGKPSTPTPTGHFWIREVLKLTDRGSGYWPYALGTADYSTLSDWPQGGVVAIHGPYHQPQLIPGRISHGCIRLETQDDAWVGEHVGVGTPVLVK
jgi:hypothetical protein